nr:MAG TPA: endonuclease-like protein [Caudoviricetes sp.]
MDFFMEQIMLKESGNLLAENIPITKELLDFALANNYKISLKTGDYGLEVQNKSRVGSYNQVLIDQIHELYINGEMYLRKYYHIFMVANGTFIVEHIFSKRGMRTLNQKEIREIYRDDIDQQTKLTCNDKYQTDYWFQSEKFKDQSKETNLRLRGVEYVSQDPNVKASVKFTNICNRGVPCVFQDPNFKEQAKQTNLLKRNVEYATQDPDVKASIRKTAMSNGGFTFQRESSRKQAIETTRRLYDCDNASSSNIVKVLRDIDRIERDERYELLTGLRDGTIQLSESEIIELASRYWEGQEREILKEFGILEPYKFLTEMKLCNLLDTLNIEYIHRAKSAHQVRNANNEYYELDVYIPNLNLGIEINGLGYHCVNKHPYDDPKTPEWHFEKFKAFRESGILMISFTDHEQDHFRGDYENIIKHHLFGEPLNISKEFLEFNQISSIEESLNYGLFDASRFTGNFEDHQHQRFIEDRDLFEYWDCGIIK